jgi:hypothetical protein
MTLTHLPFNLALARIEQIGYARCVSFTLPASSLISRTGTQGSRSLEKGRSASAGNHSPQLHRTNRQTWKPRSAESRAKKAIWSRASKARKKLEQQALALESES